MVAMGWGLGKMGRFWLKWKVRHIGWINSGDVMCSIMTIASNTILYYILKFAKTVDLKSSYHTHTHTNHNYVR